MRGRRKGPTIYGLAIERDKAGRQLGGRISEGDRAPDGAAVADCRMADIRQRRGDQRRVLAISAERSACA